MFAARSLVAALGPAVGFLLAWGAFEEPAAWGGLALAAALGVAPAAIARRAARVVCAIVVAVSGLAIAFRASPLGVLPWTDGTWLDELGRTAADGLRAFEVVVLPFDPARGPAMHALTQTAVLGFTLAASLAVAARRPLLAATVVVVGGGWATASLPDRQPLATGALLFAAAVWPTVVFRARGRRDVVVATAAVGIVGAIAVGAASAGVAPDEARLGWQSWSVFGTAEAGTNVRYVWDAQYGGISFPARPTTLLRIRGPRQAHYWRATTLDLFTADRWLENLYPVSMSRWRTSLPDDPLLPRRAAKSPLVEQTVEVAALDDDHLVAAGQPLRVRGESLGEIFFLSGGVMRVRSNGISKGMRYTIWSYEPDPTPRQLLASPPRYPAGIDRFRTLDRSVLPRFGASGRTAALNALFRDDRYFWLRSYRPLWLAAKRVARDAKSPYESTLAVERWLRSTGGFVYSETPPPSAGSPPLVDFVARTRAGYCQHFAGAMALMLRLLGVPARVAVGFTSGKWDGKEWIVSDTDAHAWVEAWFDGYGWLPFDPTPGRGSFSANYTLASDSADAVRALGRGELLAVLPETDRTATPATPATPAVDEESRSPWPLLLALGAVAIPVLLLVIAKAARRRLRYRTRDPRRLAFAARSELIDVLRDQGVNVAPGADTQTVRNALERYVGVPGGAFADAHRRARYGPPAHAGRAAAEMRAELRTIKHVVREELALRRRLLGAVSLRSLRGA